MFLKKLQYGSMWLIITYDSLVYQNFSFGKIRGEICGSGFMVFRGDGELGGALERFAVLLEPPLSHKQAKNIK